MKTVRTNETIMAALVETLEKPFQSLGITTPSGRFFVMAGIGGIVEWYFRPSWSYNIDGFPRPFALLNPGDPNATIAPPGTTAVALGLIFSLFI